MEITKLQEWIKQLHNIPQISKKRKTFMDISGLPHYENIWSNIYAFFFDIQGEHELNDLFITSLLELLEEKKHPITLNNFQIDREYETQKGGRIDLLLSNDDSAIIIEIKVNHSINNDFEDYWDSIIKDKKIGILLTLRPHHHPITTKNGGFFINITHKELIDRIISKIPIYYLTINNTYQSYLQDFCQTIYNITNPMETKILEFYYQNRKQINQLSTLRKEIIKYITNQFENEDLPKMIRTDLQLIKKQNENYVYYKFNPQKEIMLTLLYDRLWNWNQQGCRVDVYLEIQGHTLDLLKKTNKQFIETLTDKEKQSLTNNQFNKKGYEHYAHLKIDINPDNIPELINIKEKVASAINKSSLLHIADKIIQYCNTTNGTGA